MIRFAYPSEIVSTVSNSCNKYQIKERLDLEQLGCEYRLYVKNIAVTKFCKV